ncbi:MAG: flagellar hook-length control protein FliK [Burkholderiales bacterium]|nr:MAG: flagellar hook-length control protein FliK [Burkholderiales bacterium]
MLGSAQFVSPKPTLLPPAAPPAGPNPGPHGGPSFMQIMSEQPALVTPPKTGPVPEAPEAHASAEAPPAAAPAPASPGTSASSNAATRRKDTPAPPAKPVGAGPQAGQPAAQATQDGDSTDASTGETASVTDRPADAADGPDRASSLTEFTQLIGLALPTPTMSTDPAQAGALSADTRVTSDGPAGAASGRPGAAARAARGLAGADDVAPGSATRPTDPPDAKSATADRQLTNTAVRGAEAARARATDAVVDKAALSNRNGASETVVTTSAHAPDMPALRGPGATEGGPTSFAAVLAQSMPTGISAPDAPATPATGQVHAALHSPGFAPELAARVSLLASDGIQQAELQLNPADMGPVAVQIIVDGGQAQVSFHAVQVETRQALERSLPDLAAALQGQGLTLSGGGVFQQARRDAQAGDTNTGGGKEGSDRSAGTVGGRISGTTGTAQVALRRAAGLLDTFA